MTVREMLNRIEAVDPETRVVLMYKNFEGIEIYKLPTKVKYLKNEIDARFIENNQVKSTYLSQIAGYLCRVVQSM